MQTNPQQHALLITALGLFAGSAFAGCFGNMGDRSNAWEASFTPALDASACGHANETLPGGTILPDLNGEFSGRWAVGPTDFVTVALQLDATSFFGTIKCAAASANGAMSGTLIAGGYVGQYSFGTQHGNLTITATSSGCGHNCNSNFDGCRGQGCEHNCRQDCGNNNCGQNCNNNCGNQGCDSNCQQNCNNCGNQGCNSNCQQNCNNCGNQGCNSNCQQNCNSNCQQNCNNCGNQGCNSNCQQNCNNNCGPNGCVNDGCGGCSTSPYMGTWKTFQTWNALPNPQNCGGIDTHELGRETQDSDIYVDNHGDFTSTAPGGKWTMIRGHIEFGNGQLSLAFEGQYCGGQANGNCTSTNACTGNGNIGGNSISVRLERGSSSSPSPTTTAPTWTPAGSWTVTFNPPIDVSSCHGSPLTWNSQSFTAQGSGVFSERWSPSEPNTLTVDGGMGPSHFDANLGCITNPPNGDHPTGQMSGGRDGDGFSGQYSFYSKTGSVTLRRSGGPSATSPSSSSPSPSGSSSPTPSPSSPATNQIVVKSDASTLAAGLGDAGAPSDATLARLDAGDVSGLTFQPVDVGQFGTYTSMPPGAPSGAQVVNIPPHDGRNGFFKVTFTLPSGFSSPSLSGSANVDDFGRAFLNGNAISPSLYGSDPQRISQYGNAPFSTSALSNFKVGTNVLIIADANTYGGPSGAGFYATITFQT